MRDQIAAQLCAVDLTPPDARTQNGLEMLAWMISQGHLDVKVAIPIGSSGIYHEKVGIITDSAGDQVAFSGSVNETAGAAGGDLLRTAGFHRLDMHPDGVSISGLAGRNGIQSRLKPTAVSQFATLGAMRSVRGWCQAVVCFPAAFACLGASLDNQQFNGRWDISVSGNPKAWWLDVSGAGTDVVKGKFVGAPGGQLNEIPKITIFDGELRFSLEGVYHPNRRPDQRPDQTREQPRDQRRDQKQTEKGLYWARLESGKLKGTFEIEGDPFSYLEWTGVRAPVLPDRDDGTWKRGDPVNLFNGRDLVGWQPLVSTRPAGWSVREGSLTNSTGAVDLVSDKKFQNFDLHVEYLIGPRSNSGIGLRGRYEVQILDDFGRMPTLHSNGALYSRIAPLVNASKPAGEWQVFDIRLIGRQVSVTLNGFKLIDKGIIEGLTAIASDPNEAEPGPITLQGDHGLVQFRKIVVYPLVKGR